MAGYSHYPWSSSKDGATTGEAGKRSFLLSFDLKEKLVPQSHSYLIHSQKGYGPCFGMPGQTIDLSIGDKCNINASSICNIPYQYNKEGADKYKNNEDTLKLFMGFAGAKAYRVAEYEVFRVVY